MKTNTNRTRIAAGRYDVTSPDGTVYRVARSAAHPESPARWHVSRAGSLDVERETHGGDTLADFGTLAEAAAFVATDPLARWADQRAAADQRADAETHALTGRPDVPAAPAPRETVAELVVAVTPPFGFDPAASFFDFSTFVNMDAPERIPYLSLGQFVNAARRFLNCPSAHADTSATLAAAFRLNAAADVGAAWSELVVALRRVGSRVSGVLSFAGGSDFRDAGLRQSNAGELGGWFTLAELVAFADWSLDFQAAAWTAADSDAAVAARLARWAAEDAAEEAAEAARLARVLLVVTTGGI